MVLAQKQTYGSREQNREPRNKPTKRGKNYSGEKTVSPACGVGKVGQLHVYQ